VTFLFHYFYGWVGEDVDNIEYYNGSSADSCVDNYRNSYRNGLRLSGLSL